MRMEELYKEKKKNQSSITRKAYTKGQNKKKLKRIKKMIIVSMSNTQPTYECRITLYKRN